MTKKDNIFAVATPAGKSAIALFRITGPNSHSFVKKISSNKKIQKNKTTINYILNKEKKPIDQTLTTYFFKPKSYTGENMVEISCHGGRSIIKEISLQLIDLGMRVAERGEFTRRALENNKIDLVQAEAIGDLVDANTDKQRELAFSGLQGKLKNFSNETSKKIKELLANVEAIIDFSDEELPHNLKKTIKEQKKNIILYLEKAIKDFELGRSIREGFVVSVVGKTNTGKSSFVNYVSGRDVSIVTNVPGTTTDVVESLIEINGFQIRFLDTAGFRKHKNRIEEIGIKKAIDASIKSDINLVFLKKNEKKLYKKTNKKIFVRSKYDVLKNKNPVKDKEIADISSFSGYGVNRLLNKVIKKLTKGHGSEPPVVSRERHVLKLERCLQNIKCFNLDKNIDMAADDLRLALREIQEIHQKFDIDEILDIIFNDFCIGK